MTEKTIGKKMRKVLASLLLPLLALSLLTACQAKTAERTVVVYTSADQVFAEPVLKAFEASSGIRVKAVYDVEAQKTTGLVTRLTSEKNRPQCDVFWSSEVAQTILLKENEVLESYFSPSARNLPAAYRDPDGYWSGFGGRARVILVNTRLVKKEDYPTSIQDFLSSRYDARKTGIALPLFGTTNTHAAALYAYWGAEKAEKFFRDLKSRGVQVVDGNGVVRDQVVNGTLAFGLTDTDDAMTAVRKSDPVEIILPDQQDMGTLVIPNTVALVRGAPHADAGKALVDFLAGPEAEKLLLASGFCEVPVHAENRGGGTGLTIQPMQVGFEDIFKQLNRANGDLKQIFMD